MVQEEKQILVAYIGSQSFGVDIQSITDVLKQPETTPVPCSGEACAGLSNLRGHVVTMIDVRVCLGAKKPEDDSAAMAIIVEKNREFYGLLFDSIGEIIPLQEEETVPTPATLNSKWQGLIHRILRLPDDLIIVLDTERLIAAAAPEHYTV